jgi:hypothetical protein
MPTVTRAVVQFVRQCVRCGFVLAFKSHDWQKSLRGFYGSWGSTGWVDHMDPRVQVSAFNPEDRVIEERSVCDRISCNRS